MIEKTASGVARTGRRYQKYTRYQSIEKVKSPRLVTPEIAIENEARKYWMLHPAYTFDECKVKVVELGLVKMLQTTD